MAAKKHKKAVKQKKKKSPGKKNSHLWIGQGHLYQPDNENVRGEL